MQYSNTWDAQEILPAFFLGSYFAANDLQELQKRNIKCILNISDFKLFVDDNIQYCNFTGIYDSEHQSMIHLLPTAIAFIQYAVENQKPILVNCFAGVSRSTTIILAYLCHFYKMDIDTALQYIKKCRPQVNPNKGFLQELVKFQHIDKDERERIITIDRYNFQYSRPVTQYKRL